MPKWHSHFGELLGVGPHIVRRDSEIKVEHAPDRPCETIRRLFPRRNLLLAERLISILPPEKRNVRINIRPITHPEKPVLTEQAARIIKVFYRVQYRHAQLAVVEIHRTLHIAAGKRDMVEAGKIKHRICSHFLLHPYISTRVLDH
jgi:hypothetical protein